MPAPACSAASSGPAVYRRRRPERSVLYRVTQENLETWLERPEAAQVESGGVPAWVEGELRRYLECGILALGFARARCAECGHDFVVAFSCKGRGVCPSCNARRMVEVAAPMVDNVFPRLPVGQWVLSLPKRLRYFLERDAKSAGQVLQVFLRAASPDAPADARFGGVTFVQRFGSALNHHLHFHCCLIDGVFAAEDDGMRFYEATVSLPRFRGHRSIGGERSPRWEERHVHYTRLSTASASLSWSGRGGRRRSWPGSSSRRPRRF